MLPLTALVAAVAALPGACATRPAAETPRRISRFGTDDRVIDGHGGVAWAYARHLIEGQDSAGTRSFRGELLASHVLERQPDGSWRIVLAHYTPVAPR